MYTSVILLASIISSAAAAALPAPETFAADLPLGAQCDPALNLCNFGADCYAVNKEQITRCGNFQSSCTSNAQCAYNTCVNGACNGLLPTTTAPAYTPTAEPILVYLPLGAECNPNSTPCANGSDCYAITADQKLRCGNFQSSCTSNDQCAFNTCVDGACTGLLPTTTPAATTPATY
ncbi:hypothetical protein QTJ16_003870 [Diplocarpon rosae]|uniref:Uncharacterized protein n=1 Tax=Diplocarpon rosae TaxID=946125 RepID=A0AAD9SZT8_9HELO|nr:hypothetical protein QTJ16_003870 [Diplocarpon rosae]